MSGNAAEEKTEEATPRRIRQARDDGTTLTVPTATKVLTFVSILLVIAAGWSGFAGLYIAFFENAFVVTANGPPPAAVGLEALNSLLLQFFLALLIVAFLPLVIFSAIVKGGLSLSMKPITPDLSRLDPMSNLKNTYGKARLMDVVLDTLKIAAWLLACFFLLRYFLDDLYFMFSCGVSCESNLMILVFIAMLVLMLLFGIVLIVLEIPLERRNFLQRLRMTKSDVKRERKDQHGDPAIRKKRRKMRDALQSNTPIGAQHATVVIRGGGAVISTRYNPDEAGVPVVVDIAFAEQSANAFRKARKAGAAVIVDERYGVMLRNKATGDLLTEEHEYMPLLRAMSEAGAL